MSLYVGAPAPATYAITLAPSMVFPTVSDLTTVTGATFHVKLPDGTKATWSATLSGATTSTLTLTHTFSPTDLPMPGGYEVYALLTIPSGSARSATQVVAVSDEFG